MSRDFILSIPQLLISLVGIGLLRFIVDKHLFITWLEQLQLMFYQIPPDHDLKLLRQDPKKYEQQKKSPMKPKSKHRSSPRLTPPTTNETFKIQNRQLTHLKLDKHDLNKYDIIRQPLSTVAESTMALWVASTLVYFLTELYIGLTGYQGINYSIFWIIYTLLKAFYQLLKLVSFNLYYWNQGLSGASTMALVGVIQLANGLIILHLGEELLELNLDESFMSILGLRIGESPEAIAFVECAKFVLALISAVLSALYILPGWRVGAVHKNLLSERMSKWDYIQVVHAHSHAFVALALFIKPMGRAAATSFGLESCTFESMRIIYIMLALIAKAYTLPQYLRMYLELARRRINRIAKDEGGRGHTTNHELAGSISEYAITINIFIIQFMTPVLISFSLVALYKTTVCFQWLPFLNPSPMGPPPAPVNDGYFYTLLRLLPGADFTKLPNLLNPQLLRGLLAYGVWFSTLSWLSCSVIGILNAVVNGP